MSTTTAYWCDKCNEKHVRKPDPFACVSCGHTKFKWGLDRPGVTLANLRELQRMRRRDAAYGAELRVVRPGDPNQGGYEAVAVPVVFMPTVHMTTGDGEAE